jgi:hypothetical protein
MQVEDWLVTIGCAAHVCEAFRDHQIDGDVLTGLDEESLREEFLNGINGDLFHPCPPCSVARAV